MSEKQAWSPKAKLGALALVAVILGALAALVYAPGVRESLGMRKDKPQPPPPSDVMPLAPGPDNTMTDFHPPGGIPEQPPSPIDSESDPSKKPKENG